MRSNKKRKTNVYKKDKEFGANYPKSFFRSIGIKPYIKQNDEKTFKLLEKAIVKKFGNEALERFNEAANGMNDGSSFSFCHKTLDFVKLWYGVDFNRICLVANLLQSINAQNIKEILDLGGGSGHMAFFMSKLWPDSNITVLDKYSSLGNEWGKKINGHRVNFIDGALPDLSSLQGRKFDRVIMSRVLGNLDHFELPSCIDNLDTPKYFQSQNGMCVLEQLKKIGVEINKILSESGHLLIIDSWSSDRVLIVARAFEKAGLFIDTDHFNPEKINELYGLIAFSKKESNSLTQDPPLGLATIFNQDPKIPLILFKNQMAEAVKFGFSNTDVVFKLTFSTKEPEESIKLEVFEQHGIALKYFATTKGLRGAILGSSLYVPYFIESCKRDKKNLTQEV